MTSDALARRIRTPTREQAWLWLIILGASFLCLYHLDFQSLWIDEGIQYSVANVSSITEVLNRLWGGASVHPPLSFLINHIFLWAESSDLFLRLPSALFGIGSLPLIYLLTKRITSTRVALWATLVFAMSPFHIWYSQDGRMYAQLLFLLLLSSTLLLRALEQRTLQWWVLYTLVVAAGMYTHLFMAFGVMAHFLWILICRRHQLLIYTISGATVVLLYLPWLIHMLERYSSPSLQIGGGLGFQWAALPYTLFTYAAGFSLGPSVAELHHDRSAATLIQFLPVIVLVGAVFGLLLVSGIVLTYRHFGPQALILCLAGFCVPIAGVILFSLMRKHTFNVRYTIAALPYFYMIIGVAVAALGPKLRMIALLAIFGISATSLANHFSNPRYAKEDVRSAVLFWRQTSEHELLLSVGSSPLVKRYLENSDDKLYVPIAAEDIVASIDSILKTIRNTAYVLITRDWQHRRERAIRSAFQIDNEQSYPGVTLLKISAK